MISFDNADGPDRDDPSDKFTNYNSEQTLTRKESECKRKASDDSDLGPPSEGFTTLFAPSDEVMEQGLPVAEAATGKLRIEYGELVSWLII